MTRAPVSTAPVTSVPTSSAPATSTPGTDPPTTADPTTSMSTPVPWPAPNPAPTQCPDGGPSVTVSILLRSVDTDWRDQTGSGGADIVVQIRGSGDNIDRPTTVLPRGTRNPGQSFDADGASDGVIDLGCARYGVTAQAIDQPRRWIWMPQHADVSRTTPRRSRLSNRSTRRNEVQPASYRSAG